MRQSSYSILFIMLSVDLLAAILLNREVAAAEEKPKGAATYVVRFAPKDKVGTRYAIEMEADQTIERKILQGEDVLRSQEMTTIAVFRATVEVLEVNEQGIETKKRYQVRKAVLKSDAKEARVLPEDAVFVAQAGKKETEFRMPDGSELPPIAQHILPRLIQIDTSEVTLEALFGGPTPRRVGDTWEVSDPKLVVESARQHDQTVTAEDISAHATLVGVEMVDGKEYLEIHTETTIKNLSPPSPIPQAEPFSAELAITQTMTIPVDGSTGPIAQTHTVKMRQVLRGKEGTAMAGQTLDATSTESRRIKYEYLAAIPSEDAPSTVTPSS